MTFSLPTPVAIAAAVSSTDGATEVKHVMYEKPSIYKFILILDNELLTCPCGVQCKMVFTLEVNPKLRMAFYLSFIILNIE